MYIFQPVVPAGAGGCQDPCSHGSGHHALLVRLAEPAAPAHAPVRRQQEVPGPLPHPALVRQHVVQVHRQHAVQQPLQGGDSYFISIGVFKGLGCINDMLSSNTGRKAISMPIRNTTYHGAPCQNMGRSW